MPNTLHLITLKTALAGLITLASECTQTAVQRQRVSHDSRLDETPMLTTIGLRKRGVPA